MPSYRQLSIEERCEIARLHEGGQSIRQIAAALDRQPSTVSRELKRNTGSKIATYQPDGPVEPGSFATQEPGAAELERRSKVEDGTW